MVLAGLGTLAALLAPTGTAGAEELSPRVAAERRAAAVVDAHASDPVHVRLHATRAALAALHPYAVESPKLRVALRLAEVMLDRASLRADPLRTYVEAWQAASSEPQADLAVHALAERVVAMVAAWFDLVAPEQMTAGDVDHLLAALREARVLSRPKQETTATRGLPKLATSLYELAHDLPRAPRDRLQSAASAVLQALAPEGLSLPAGAVAAILDTTAQRTEEAAEVLRELRHAIEDGSPDAIASVVERAERFERDLFRESYGKTLERYLRDRLFPELPLLGPRATGLAEQPAFEGEEVSSYEVGNTIVAPYAQQKLIVYTDDDGRPTRMLLARTQPVIRVNKDDVEIKVWIRVLHRDAGGPPSAFALGFLTGMSPSGQTVTSVTVTFANGETRQVPSHSGRSYSFRPGPHVIREIHVEHAFAGKAWSETFTVPGY